MIKHISIMNIKFTFLTNKWCRKATVSVSLLPLFFLIVPLIKLYTQSWNIIPWEEPVDSHFTQTSHHNQPPPMSDVIIGWIWRSSFLTHVTDGYHGNATCDMCVCVWTTGVEVYTVQSSIHSNEHPSYVFLFWKLRGLSPNLHIHVSVSHLYISRICPHIWLQQNRQTDPGNI